MITDFKIMSVYRGVTILRKKHIFIHNQALLICLNIYKCYNKLKSNFASCDPASEEARCDFLAENGTKSHG